MTSRAATIFCLVLAKCLVLAPSLVLANICASPSHAMPDKALQKDFARAKLLFDGNQKPEAQRLLLQICKQPNATPQMRVLLADTFLDLSGVDEETPELREAESGLQLAMKQDPEYGRIYKDMAEFCNLREQYQQAIELCTKALHVKRPDVFALRQRAIAYSHLGKYKEAHDDLKSYIKQNGETCFNYSVQGEIEQSMKDYAAAEESYRHALSLSEARDSRLFHQLVDCLKMQKKYAEAIKEVSAAIGRNPKSPDLLELRSTLYIKTGNTQAALADLSAAIILLPTAKYYRARADLYKTLGRKAEAEQDLKREAGCSKNPIDLMQF